jgi:CheY-like chemotaxis protein
VADILVIDDDKGIRQFLRASLKEAGHRVREAADGAEGLAAYRKRPADLVVCDIYMPEKEGLETILELRQEFPDAKVVAISGGHDPEIDMLAYAKVLGAAVTITKPFTQKELLDAVNRTLAAQS